jgi:hypothetical protein
MRNRDAPSLVHAMRWQTETSGAEYESGGNHSEMNSRLTLRSDRTKPDSTSNAGLSDHAGRLGHAKSMANWFSYSEILATFRSIVVVN